MTPTQRTEMSAHAAWITPALRGGPARAQALETIAAAFAAGGGLRPVARRLGVSLSTLQAWLAEHEDVREIRAMMHSAKSSN